MSVRLLLLLLLLETQPAESATPLGPCTEHTSCLIGVTNGFQVWTDHGSQVLWRMPVGMLVAEPVVHMQEYVLLSHGLTTALPSLEPKASPFWVVGNPS
jgi:hypothetical protein